MQRMKFRGFYLYFENRDAAESMIRQADEFPSFFTPREEQPLIIDCGANIGVSMLEWKTRWPGAQILCFEPDPFAFRLLEQNVERNDIPGVRCVNAALSDCDATVMLHGDISRRGDARGNSIDAAWGSRSGTTHTAVAAKRLSPYIADREVALLKLDIEGVEQRVLQEIAPHLQRVQAIYVEVHETDASIAHNSAATIEQTLRAANFTLETESRYDAHALPAHLDAWREEVNARQTQLIGWR